MFPDNIKLDCINNFINSIIIKSLVLSGFLSPCNLFLINKLLKSKKKILYITTDEQGALKAQKDLENLLKIKSDIYPAQDIGLYSELEKNYYIYSEQINIFLSKPDVVFMNVRALLEKFPSLDFYKNNIIKIKKNDTLNYSTLSEKLTNLGYKRVSNVSDIGEFSLRGDILDIYSFDKNPVRIEFFADNIEDIRYFNPANQKSFQKIEKTTIYPLYKFVLNDKNKQNFKNEILKTKDLDEDIKKIKDELIEKIDTQGYFEGIEYYINYLNDNIQNVLEFFEDYIVIFEETSQVFAKYENFENNCKNEYKSNTDALLSLPLQKYNHLEFDELKKQIKKHRIIALDNFIEEEFYNNADKIIDFDLSLPPLFSSDIKNISKYIKKNLKDGYKIFICSNFPNRLKEIFDEYEIFSDNIYYYPDITTGGVIINEDKISDEKLLFLSDKELFSKHTRDITTRKYYSNKSSRDFIDSINDIKEGEYVVHSIHGIGIYNGLTKQTLDDNQKDYLEIQFQGTDKLYMPAEQINLLYRYRGSGNVKPKLSKMGGSAWETTKAKAKKEVEQIAYDLLDLYAKRQIAKGIEFDQDTPWQYEMEENFEFTETPDQMKAIKAVKKDMEENKPMDRLICADVGFGKTEIAIRAVFKAVMSGYQAALIAPTTILTLQHFETLKERFEPFQLKVGLLNRFCSKKEQTETVKQLEKGEVDVVIGTHRILSDDVKFKKLGLLIIDEEHKFGVRHKEKLKKFKENIDVLSLSATPIPRTLNMALSGIKDLSVINTPPKNRLPVKTYVGEYSISSIKNAINREIQREGQVFYLYNRVETIELFKQKLSEIVPNARIALAHGQMKEGLLEEIMCKFENREFDILLSTTIIESGLDIPNANTIIIHDADKFGLAQLYQLRGRVGRCEKQAYCFCFYKKSKELNEEARKRLNAIKDFSTLGSGYQIALRDIEIRGVGNLLGTSQHGQMLNVGFDTYCNLLKECIEDIQSRKGKNPYEQNEIKHEPTIVDINADAYIPDDWAPTVEQKILEYKRLSDVTSISELNDMELNLKDRFSKIPDCVLNLIKLIKLRILASSAGISKVLKSGNTISIYTPFSQIEWKLLKSKIDPKITRYFTYSPAVKSSKNIQSILLMNKNEDNFDEIFNKLSDLFYYISETVLNFKINN